MANLFLQCTFVFDARLLFLILQVQQGGGCGLPGPGDQPQPASYSRQVSRVSFCRIWMCSNPFWSVNRGLQRYVVYLGWPIAPSYMSPNAEGEGGRLWPWGLSQWVQLYTGAQLNFGDLTSYLTYACRIRILHYFLRVRARPFFRGHIFSGFSLYTVYC